ncbi:MAG: hypothetical protein EON92_19190 [Burkholderiales bacterium]|nr:MAG: hypothetical protein EON92_19190 [Burkholderiales bacterium]
MIEMGLIVGFGLLVTLYKMTWTWKLRVLSHPLKMDVLIFVVLFALHAGTFSGVMVATIGALVCSLVLSAGRTLYGYIEDGSYVAGTFNMSSKL